MQFLSVLQYRTCHGRRRCVAFHSYRHTKYDGECGRDRDGALRLGAYLHVVMPAVVVVATLVLQAVHNSLPFVTLVALVSAAYGRLLWLEFLEREHRLLLMKDPKVNDMENRETHDLTEGTGQ